MKYITLTFDDGRYDNYQYAFPILKKYGINATLFCTSGYIDGTWSSIEGWKSAEKPITVEQLNELQKNGWEIALHGDKHVAKVDDLKENILKLEKWGFVREKYGFSLPNSSVDDSEIHRIICSDYGKRIDYIRRGRRTNTSSIKSKVLYVLYSLLKFQWAYTAFNQQNVSTMRYLDRYNLPSVVIKKDDEPRMILSFIEKLPDNTHMIFMFHSVLPKDNPFYGRDSWCWSTYKLEKLCAGLLKMSGYTTIENLSDVLEKYR